jgi:hypothetical protein
MNKRLLNKSLRELSVVSIPEQYSLDRMAE